MNSASTTQARPDQPAEASPESPLHCMVPVRAEAMAEREDGRLVVRTADGREIACDWLESHLLVGRKISRGDTVLAMVDPLGSQGVVVGRIGPRAVPVTEPVLTIQAEQALALKCGEASIDLRADGKVMIRGDDVLVRAKGTQRIRAGTVAIN